MVRQWKYKRMSDESLMLAYVKGQSKAFDVLYQRHKPCLFLYLKRQSDNYAICEELVHDTWMAVINHASSYQSGTKFKSWLFRIAHNRLVDHWRKFGSQSPVIFEELNDHITRQLSSGLDSVVSNIQITELITSLRTLSIEQRESVLLKIEGFSQNEIAEITNTNKETVKSRLRYATKTMRLSMENIV